MTTRLDNLREALRARASGPDASVETMRRDMDANCAPMPVPPEVTVEPITMGGVPAERLTPPGDTRPGTVLYLHGGGYCIGSLLSVRVLGANLAMATGAEVIDLDYRLAPEHPCPAAIEDVLAAYDALLAAGAPPDRVAIAGDSAGGGLTIAALLAIRDSGRPLPSTGICISPLLDCAYLGDSMETNAESDPMVTRQGLTRMAAWYAGDLPLDDPRVSPMYADLAGLPPLLLHVGGAECLYDDVLRFAEVARSAGVELTCSTWPDMIHVWHMFAPRLADATTALAEIGTWTVERWGGG